MSTISTTPTVVDAHGHGNGHDPHLAHHFDSPEQQMASGKLGMWVFLATEILMFGGLFCAYSVYRHNHPEVFEFAHQYLDKTLGAINTIVLITSSLTMAWGVRLAQLGKQRGLVICLTLTILGGFVFMGIKSVEYKAKWQHHLGLGSANRYDPRYKPSDGGHADQHGALKNAVSTGGAAEHNGAEPGKAPPEPNPAKPATVQTSVEGHPVTAQIGVGGMHPAATQHTVATISPDYLDPNAGTPDAAKIVPVAPLPSVLAPSEAEAHRKAEAESEEEHERQLEGEYDRLGRLDQQRTSTFFQIYFLMTGLHGIHVIVGMALIFWLLVRAVPQPNRRTVMLLGLASVGLFFVYVGALVGHRPTLIIGVILLLLAATGIVLRVARPQPAPVFAAGAMPLGYNGAFSPEYFAPVDIVGLYWHLVDLIWIFLFPLLYLIH
jgi:cytochrome c oxidase subunit 3